MLEKWNNGEMGFGEMVMWNFGQIVKNHLTIRRVNYLAKSDEYPLDINIPLFRVC